MSNMTLEQLRVANASGGISGVTLKGQGSAFLVQINTRSGADAVLTKARSNEPRRFGNPLVALSLLHDLGITAGQFDASAWAPAQQPLNRRDDARAQLLREAHQASAYVKWLSSEIQESIDDPRPSIAHDEVLAQLDTRIARHQATGKPA